MVKKDEEKEWRKRDMAMAGAGGITMFALIPSLLGFTSAGIAAKTFASYIMIPTTIKGGLFATIQSASAKGMLFKVATMSGGIFSFIWTHDKYKEFKAKRD